MSEHDDGGELIGGRYALGELLGVGGTGSVFAATDRSADGRRDVAVKLLHPHLCDDDASRAAFLREAEQVAELQHPNIVRVYGAGLHDAGGVIMPWIALELLDGPTLREWVDSVGRLSSEDAAAVADGLLAGLDAAHAAKLVHRDISPQNVILHGAGDLRSGDSLTPDMVRIVDFGLADVAGRSTLGHDVLLATRSGVRETGDSATAAGVVGNAAYMSPEQAQGRAVWALSDLYQAGAVLYFALTGRPPFPRATTEQVLQAHVSAPPPVPSALNPAARPLDRVVARAMAKNPIRRYLTAARFRVAIDEAMASAAALQAALDQSDEHDGEADAARSTATRVLLGASAGDLGYLSPVLPPAAPPSSSRATTSGGVAAAVLAGAVIVGLAGWAVMAAAAAPPEPTAVATSTPNPTTSASAPPIAEEPTPSAAPSTEPPVVEAPHPVEAAVPALRGSLADADAGLRAAGFVLGTVTRVESPEVADRVLSQNPAAGASLAPGATVNLTVASGSNVVPQVSGMTGAAAAAMLQSAGFLPSGDRGAAAVDGSQPAAGTVLRVGVTVTFNARPVPTPEPTPTSTGATPQPEGE